MDVKRLNWLFSPLVLLLLFSSCKPDDRSGNQHPVMQRHLADYAPTGDVWGFIDAKGNIAIDAQFDDVRAFHEGLAPANKDGRWGYIDKSGRWAIKPNFIKAHPFEDGLARVRFANGLMGLINSSSDTILHPSYDELYFRNGNHYITAKNERKGLINAEGQVVLDNKFEDVKIVLGQLIATKIDNKYSIIDKNQSQKIEGILAIKKGGLLKTDAGWGMIDSDCNWVLNPKEPTLMLGHKGHVIVKRDNKPAILNLRTNIYSAIDSKRLTYLNENRYAAKLDQGWLLLDQNGRPLNGRPFESIYKFTEGVAAYGLGDWWGYIDIDGTIISDAIFALPWNSSEGKIRLFAASGFGFLDLEGNLVIEPKFTDVRDFSEGLAAYME